MRNNVAKTDDMIKQQRSRDPAAGAQAPPLDGLARRSLSRSFLAALSEGLQ